MTCTATCSLYPRKRSLVHSYLNLEDGRRYPYAEYINGSTGQCARYKPLPPGRYKVLFVEMPYYKFCQICEANEFEGPTISWEEFKEQNPDFKL